MSSAHTNRSAVFVRLMTATVLLAGLCAATAGIPISARAFQGPAETALVAAARDLPQLRSLLVSRHGELVAEYYARGVGPTRLENVKSASKSVIAALVGIAIQRGYIKGLREPIAAYFPELKEDRDARKRSITIEDLLTMRAGLESTSGPNYGRWVQSPNWVRFALARPMVAEPGSDMQYSTGSSHLLSAILTNTGKPALERRACPSGSRRAMAPDPRRRLLAATRCVTPKQMVALGELYLHRGRVNGRQIVPEAWVDTSCVPRTASVFDADRRYGYGWWIQQFDGGTQCFAWGYGGQYIFVFRDLDLVVTATSSAAVSEERRGHRRRLFELVEQQVLAPLRAADGTP